jgi:hypothetical protein
LLLIGVSPQVITKFLKEHFVRKGGGKIVELLYDGWTDNVSNDRSDFLTACADLIVTSPLCNLGTDRSRSV